MKVSFFRLEDFGPSPLYTDPVNIQKLRAMADFLFSENVPYNISLIPRFVDPANNYDKNINETTDPVIAAFVDLIKYMDAGSGILGMHGYTHQYANSKSGSGFEFAYNGCTSNCPPDDPPQACTDRTAFEQSYVYAHMLEAYNTFTKLNADVDWAFSTPHYNASKTQRCLLEAWGGILFETNPYDPTSKSMAIRDTDNAFYRGVVYIPTPLSYIQGQADVDRICTEIDSYTEQDVAAFYYHPFLELQFIQITPSGVIYDNNSYLKQLVRCFKEKGFTFGGLDAIVSFSPFYRQTSFFPGTGFRFYTGCVNGDGKDEFIIWEPATGTWTFAISNLLFLPWRQNPPVSVCQALTNWAVGTSWQPFTGHFNGNPYVDIVIRDPILGNWQVALTEGLSLNPDPGPNGDFYWLKNWGAGTNLTALTGDFNGDGKDDLLIYNGTNGNWQVALSDGTKFVPNPSAAGFWLTNWAKGGFWLPVVGDFNGDGKDDIAVWNWFAGEWQVALSTGTSFVPNIGPGNFRWLYPWAVGRSWTPFSCDVNGDGIDDLLVVDTTMGDWQVAISKGDRFSPFPVPFKPWAADPAMQPLVGDFNGDGRCDICARNPVLRNGTIDFSMSILGSAN